MTNRGVVRAFGLIVFATLTSVLLARTSKPAGIEAVAGALLVCIGPGAAVTNGWPLNDGHHGVWAAMLAVGWSLVAAIGCGAGLAVSGIGLDRASWALGLGGLTCGIALVSLLDWRNWSPPSAPHVPRAPVHGIPLAVVLFLAAGAALYAAVTIAVGGAKATDTSQRFNQLWAVRRTTAAGTVVTVGIRSHVDRTQTITVRIHGRAPYAVDKRVIQLAPNGTTRILVPITDTRRQTITVTARSDQLPRQALHVALKPIPGSR
jgi:hypothetical protein